MNPFQRIISSLSVFLLFLLPAQSQVLRVRIAAGNISSGNGQDYTQGHGIRIFQGVKPDIILIQEFNYLSNSTADIRNFVTTTFGASFSYFRESNTGSIPNGVISRYPILESGQWVSTVAERDYAWARIDLPGNRELLAVSVHLPTDDAKRPAEAGDLIRYVNNYYAAGNARSTDYLVIGGDFNSDTRSESALSTLGALVTIGIAQPADKGGNVNTNAGRNKPYDAVYAGKGLQTLQIPTVLGGSTFPNGLVADTRVYSPISEIAPALSTDSGATNMQHQAVIKDFQLPAAADPAVLELLDTTINSTPPFRVQITFRSTVGTIYEVQASPNLTATSWSDLGSFNATATSTSITVVPADPAPGQVVDGLLGTEPQRYYRIIRR